MPQQSRLGSRRLLRCSHVSAVLRGRAAWVGRSLEEAGRAGEGEPRYTVRGRGEPAGRRAGRRGSGQRCERCQHSGARGRLHCPPRQGAPLPPLTAPFTGPGHMRTLIQPFPGHSSHWWSGITPPLRPSTAEQAPCRPSLPDSDLLVCVAVCPTSTAAAAVLLQP